MTLSNLEITRRQLLGGAIGTAAGLAIAGLPAGMAQAAPRQQAVRRGGQIVQAQAWTYPTFDLHIASVPQSAGYHLIFDYLLRYELTNESTGEHQIRPALAESYEQSDPTTVVFQLRRGVKFHDGSEFNADVAKWNVLRLRDEPRSFGKSHLTDVDSVDAVGDYTLKITLKGPSSSLPYRLSGANYGVMGMMSKAEFERVGADQFGRQPSGTGPFKFRQWITDDRLTLDKNPDYWRMGDDGSALPYLDSIVSRYTPDLTVAMADLQAGQLHAAEGMPANQLPVVQMSNSLKLVEWPWAGPTFFMMGFNTRKAPFDNLKVRQAALYAIDRESMAQALGFGWAKPREYPYWNAAVPGYDTSVERYEYNPDKAKQLLAEAGFSGGVDTDLLVIQREPEATIGQFAAEMWTKAGIRTKLGALERLSWINQVRADDFQACFWRNTPQQGHPVQIGSNINSTGPNNWSGFKDADIDRMMAEADAQSDSTRRADLYRQVLQRLQDQAYVGVGYTLPFNYVVNAKLNGVKQEFGVPDFAEAWLSG